MALSFLSQNSGLLDLQSIFDPQYTHHHQQQQQHLIHHPQHHLQPQQQQQEEHIQQQRTLSTKFDLNLFNELDQMEFNNNLNRDQYQNNNINNSGNNQNTNNNTNTNNSVSENLNQVSLKATNDVVSLFLLGCSIRYP